MRANIVASPATADSDETPFQLTLLAGWNYQVEGRLGTANPGSIEADAARRLTHGRHIEKALEDSRLASTWRRLRANPVN